MIQHDSAVAYDAARHRTAFVDRSHLGRIVVSGTERASYLQGLLTNDIVALKAGHGCYAAYLTAQGRMIADLRVHELGDAILLTMIGAVKDVVLAKLDQFIFSEDVQLGDVTDAFAQVAVVGPGAAASVAAIVSGVPEDQLRALPEHGNLRSTWAGGTVIVVRVVDTGEPGFDLHVERAQAGALKAALIAGGAVELDEADAEVLRIESGVPLFGRDMDEETIPLEAGIESQAISFSKGCYVGQEIIIRVLHRGHGRVARKLVGLTIDGDQVPAPGVAIHSGDREVGRVTSAAMSPRLNRPIALGYVQRDFVDQGTSVTIGEQKAEVTALPFVSPEAGSDLAFRAKREI
jgi:folate-binding protein YgfZ